MKKKLIEKPAVLPNLYVEGDSEDTNSKRLFSGLNLAAVMEQLKKSKSFYEASQLNKPTVSPDNRCLQVDSKPENQTVHGLFYGLHVEEALKNFIALTEPGPTKRLVNNNSMPVKPPPPETRLSKICTADVIASLMKVKKNKRVKESTLATYQKRLMLFQQRFTCLPENPEAIMDYLSRFDGESGRHRRNHQDLLNMLYGHATRRFGLLKNPVAELERPIVTRKPVKTLSLEQVRVLNQTPINLQERTALDLVLGHGWRQIEPRRVQAKDVAGIDHLLIMCHGKERPEPAPVLPETADRLREMARGLEPDDFIFVAQRKRHGRRAPLGEDGMSQLIGRLMARAGIKGFTGHDLRRTFATLVTTASHDEFLAMRLMRDRVPGLSERYISYPMSQLVEALQKYSPIRQAGDGPLNGDTLGEDSEKVSTATKPSPVSEAGEVAEIAAASREGSNIHIINEPLKGSSVFLVETGESRTPRPEEAAQDMLQA